MNTVCGKEPDAEGNVSLTAKDVSAVPTAGGTMTGNLSVPAPVEALHAVNKGYVDTTDTSATLTVSGWTGSGPYTQTIVVQGLTDGKRVMAHPKFGSNIDTNIAMREACGCISYAERSGNSVVFTCLEDKPEVDITVTFEIYV